MESNRLESIVVGLKEQEASLVATIADLDEQTNGKREELKRVQAALEALNPTPKAVRKRKSPSKPSASKADVESALMGAKDSNPGASDEELRSIAENSLIEQGFSRSGMALRFKQVIAQTVGN